MMAMPWERLTSRDAMHQHSRLVSRSHAIFSKRRRDTEKNESVFRGEDAAPTGFFARSLRLDAGGFDHLGGFFDFIAHEFLELGRRHDHGLGAQGGQALFHVGLLQHAGHVAGDFFHDRRWVPAGAKTPTQSVKSNPGTPASARVGTVGKYGEERAK